MMAIAYLQPFVDGNKRAGRRSCNIPLLREGLPPMSFVGLDKADYLTALLLLFYETGDTGLMADIVSDAYVKMAPTYAASVVVHRRPRSVELREQTRIDSFIQAVVPFDCRCRTTGTELESQAGHLTLYANPRTYLMSGELI